MKTLVDVALCGRANYQSQPRWGYEYIKVGDGHTKFTFTINDYRSLFSCATQETNKK